MDNLKESTPNTGTDLTSDLLAEITSKNSLGFSADNNNDTDPKKKTSKVETPTDSKTLGMPTTSSISLLDGMSRFAHQRVEAGAERDTKVNLDELAGYLNTDFISSREAAFGERARNQSNWEQARNMFGRIGANVLPEVLSNIVSAFDINSYYENESQINNTVVEYLKSIQDNVNKTLPIYRENPDKPLDIGDAAYWFESGGNLVTSAVGFVGAGYVTGGGVGTIFSKAGQAAKWINTLGKATRLGDKGINTVRGATTLTNALMLNQAESFGIGVDTYNQVYNNKLTELRANPENSKLSDVEIDTLAKQKASEAAASAINFNRINILLNLSSANLFLKTPIGTRALIEAPSRLKTLKGIGLEGLQEAAEENINMIAQNQAVEENYTFKDALNDVGSREGLESTILGFIGGAGQTALTKAGKMLPIYKNTAFRNEYNNAYSKLIQEGYSSEEADAKSQEIALNKVKSSSNRVSDNFIRQQRYILQQQQIEENNNLGKVSKINDVTSVFYNAQEETELYNNLADAVKEKDTIKIETLQNRLLYHQAYKNFELGTTDSLIELYNSLGNLSKEEAEEKGLYNRQDEGTEDDYRTKAKNAVKTIEQLERIYLESKKYINSNEVYGTQVEKLDLDTKIEKRQKEALAVIEQAKVDLKNKPEFLPGDTYLVDGIITRDSLNKVTPRFRQTGAYRKFKDKVLSLGILQDTHANVQQHLDNITRKEYQDFLAKVFKDMKEAEVNKRKQKDIDNKKKESKDKINKIVKNIENKIDVSPVENSVEVETDIIGNEVVEETNIQNNVPVVDIPTEQQSTIVEPINNNQLINDLNITANFPVFNEPELDNNLQAIKNAVENPNEDVDKLHTNLINFTNSFSNASFNLKQQYPLWGKDIDSTISELNRLINIFKDKINSINNISSNLKQDITGFVDELFEDNNTDIESDDNPDTVPNFAKTLKQAKDLFNLLQKLSSAGVDIYNFREVIITMENVVGKENIISVFNKIKNVYNLALETNIEGSYEELILEKYQNRGLLNRVKRLSMFNIPKGLYNFTLDKITQDNLELFNTLGKLQGINAETSGFVFKTYNETGSNLLAYLSKLYQFGFTPKQTNNGDSYIEVTEQDINNLLNDKFDKRILSPKFLNVGTEITFVPLSEVTLEDGTILSRANTTIDDAPIGIKINDELIEGLYLHDVSWINATRLNNTIKGIEEDQNKLRALRKYILESETPIKTKIISRSPGVPILDSTAQLKPVNINMPGVGIVISKNGKFYDSNDTVIQAVNTKVFDEGKTGIVIPFGKSKLVLPVKRNKLQDVYIDSIISALETFIKGKKNNISSEIEKLLGINILTQNGFEEYITQFIQNTYSTSKNFEEFKESLETVPERVNLINFRNGNLYYGYGLNDKSNYISKNKYANVNDFNQDILHFRQHLKDTYFNVNLDNLKSNKKIILIENNVVTSYQGNYNDFVSENLLTSYLSFELDNGERIYTIQSKLNFDIDSTGFNSIETNKKEEQIKYEESQNTEVVKDINTNPGIQKLPDGSTFNIDEIDFDANPDITNQEEINFDYLLESSNLIKGVPINIYNNLIESISSRFYTDALEENQEDNISIKSIEKEVNLFIQSLELLKDSYKTAFELGRAINLEEINNQLDALINNKEKIIKAVRKRIAKKGMNLATISDLSENDIILTREESDKNNWLDIDFYKVDPRTTLTKEVKNFLEGIKDYKIVRTEKGETYVPKKNILNNNIIIPFDNIYITLTKILVKSNDNIINLNYDTVIKLLKEELSVKPYLFDVINKLEESDNHFKNAFVTSFNKHHSNHLYLSVNYDNVNKEYTFIPTPASSKNISNLVLSEWQNNLKYKNVFIQDGNTVKINKEFIKQFEKQYEAILNNPQLINRTKDWLESIGIVIPDIVQNNFMLYGMYRDGQLLTMHQHFDLSNGIFKNIKNRIVQFANDNKEVNPEVEYDINTLNVFSDSSITDLAKTVAKYRNDLFQDNFKNGNGDTVHSYVNNKYAIDRFFKLKDDNLSLQYLLDIPYSAGSIWFNNLIKTNDEGIRYLNKEGIMYKYFKYYTADSIKYQNNKLGKVIDTLSESQLEDFKLGLFLNRGLKVGKGNNKIPIMKVLYPTMSDKSNIFIFQVPRVEYKFPNGKLSDNDRLDLVKILFYPEIDRIKQYQLKKGNFNNKEYNKGGGRFISFPLLNDIKELWNEDGTLKEEVGTLAEYDVILTKQLSRILSNIIQEKRQVWKDAGIIKTNKKGEEYLKIDKDYKNEFGNNVDSILKNYVINTTIANLNFQQLFIGDPALFTKDANIKSDSSLINEVGQNIANSIITSDNQGKRLAMDNAGKVSIIAEENETLNWLVIDDVKMKSTASTYIESLFKGTNVVDKYNSIDASDAQEYTTLEEHLKVMFKAGKITEDNMNRILDIYNKTGKVELSDKNMILQPMKPVYGNNFLYNDIDTRLYVKSSSIPLIAELTKDTALDGLRLLMEGSSGTKIDRVAFASAVKVGQPANIPQVFTDNGNTFKLPKDWRKGLLLGIPREGHGIQQEVPYDEDKNEVNDGTQQSKLLFNNILDVEGFIHPETGESVNGRTLLESYNNNYKQLFFNKYDKLLKDLDFNTESGQIGNLSKLKNILVEEGLARNYNINDINSFSLDELALNFSVPIWLNNSENKISALLNSIVDNRIRKRKVRGKSFVLASQVGLGTIDSINENNIIKHPNWDGTLKASMEKDGTITYAEVLVPFKFWNSEGNSLKIQDFIKDGVIDINKIPEQLLTSFGYRIPTQGLNSMSTIKIVGFLPDSYEDIVIAPADFVIQMGSDFDVDKLYTHMYKSTYNEDTKSLEIISKKHLNKKNTIKNSIEIINKRLKDLRNELGSKTAILDKNKALRLNTAENIQKEIDILQVKIYAFVSQRNIFLSNNLLNMDIENSILENNILDIHFSVLNNPAKEVQKARINPLGFGNLPSLVNKVSKNINKTTFSPFNDNYQSYKYTNARAGKNAVGLFSLDSVFNAVLQYIEGNVNFYKTTKEGIEIDYNLNIAGYNNVNLNNPNSSVPGKYKSDVISAFQSAALDNEKEQLLGKLNINSNTFDTIRAMSLMGFDENIIIAFINQPIIIEYFNKAIEIPSFNENFKILLKKTSLEKMFNNIKDGNIDTEYQKAVLYYFNDLSNKGAILKQIQSTINSDSSGIGKNFFYSLTKGDQILTLPKYDSDIRNISKLIGDYSTSPLEDSVDYKGTYIKPNSISGFASTFGVLTNNKLWNNFYLYNKGKIRAIFTAIIESQNETYNTIQKQADALNRVTNSFKSFLSSNTFHLWGKDTQTVNDLRYNLLYDTETNMSLGSIINNLTQKDKPFTNPLLDRLQIGRNNVTNTFLGRIPTVINYYNAGSIEMNEEIIINSIIDMLVNNTYLGVYNNKNYTTRNLAEDLIAYQMITSGIQQSNNFIKFIPIEYLKNIGYYNNMIANYQLFTNEDFVNSVSEAFYTQYIQHNPDEFYNEEIAKNYEVVDGKLFSNGTIKRPLVVLSGLMPNSYRIFKYNKDIKDFVELDTLGYKGLQEYDMWSSFAGKSTVYIQQVNNNIDVLNKSNLPVFINNKFKEPNTEYIPDEKNINDFLSLDRDTEQDNSPLVYNTNTSDLSKKYYLTDTSLPIAEKYKHILRKIRKNSDNTILSYFAGKVSEIIPVLNDIPLYVDTNLQAKGRLYKSKVFGEPYQIRINPNKIKTEEELQRVLLEEIVHAITAMEVDKGNSTFIKNLELLRQDAIKFAKSKYGEGIIDIVNDKVKTKKPLITGTESNIIYNLSNLQEFIAASINNVEFQKFLNSINVSDKTKSLWKRLIDAITSLLESLGVKKDSNLSVALHEIINLFDNVIKPTIYSNFNKPKFVRTVEYLNNKFNLVNNEGILIQKANAEQIVNFINNNIVNVIAKEQNGTVIIEPNRLIDYSFDSNYETEYEIIESTPVNFPSYKQALELRVKKLRTAIKKAKDEDNFVRVSQLDEVYKKDKDLLSRIDDINFLGDIADKGEQDLQVVNDMLKRPLTSEDIVYARSIINFWKNSKELLFNDIAKKSKILVEAFTDLEVEAGFLADELLRIEKEFLQEFVKKYIGKETDIDKIFEDYKDINFLQSNFRDISTYDNEILTSIWSAVKQANINAQDEFNQKLEGFDKLLDKVLPILKSFGNKELFEVFRQKKTNGKLTGHLVNPYSNLFYKDKNKVISNLIKDNKFENYINLTNFIKTVGENTNLSLIFPANGEITDEVIKAREELKNKLGQGAYNLYIKKQEKRLKSYQEHKDGYIEVLLDRYNLKDREDILNNEEAKRKYENWQLANSPYELEKHSFNKINNRLSNFTDFQSHKFYEIIPIKEDKTINYFDSNFDIISNNNDLYEFYSFIESTFDDLRKFVPDEQQKALAYGGLPYIEKTLIEMFNERGMHLGYKPIYDAFIESMQSSFSDNTNAVLDPVTGQPEQDMRIPIIKDNYQFVKDYINKRTIEYVSINKKQPSVEYIQEFEEDAVHEYSQKKSFDLGKVVKSYTALVLAHKHKAKIEDSIKIANTVIDSYKESYYRPDGIPITNKSGIIMKKQESESFLKLKEALDNYTKANIYNDIREEEGKGKKILTPTEKEEKKDLENKLEQLQEDLANNVITQEDYDTTFNLIVEQLANQGKTFIYSKAGDNMLKYLQLKLMGWNVLGGISNMGFGWIANYIEAADGRLYSKRNLNYGYKLVLNSIGKNVSFNYNTGLYNSETANKIRSAMDKWDVLKDASNELYTNTTSNSFNKRLKWLAPYNMQQRTEYINQAPLLIALAKETKVNTIKGEVSIWDAMDNDFNWNTAEYGEAPTEVITKLRLKLDQIIKRNHGNYDPLSTINAKRTFLGRAGLQFRTWMLEAIAVRAEKERFDDILGITVKGRYRSVGTVYSNTNIGKFALEFFKGLINKYSFGLYKNGNFEGLVDGENIKEVDAANMRKVITEVSMAINLYILLLLAAGLKDDDDENNAALNVLMNQGIRLRTDLLLYVNPMEARNLIRDIIPATAIIKDIWEWIESVGTLVIGEDEIKAGVHSGNSKFVKETLQMLPFGTKAYSLYNSSTQVFEKR
jgi:hypothetical protein